MSEEGKAQRLNGIYDDSWRSERVGGGGQDTSRAELSKELFSFAFASPSLFASLPLRKPSPGNRNFGARSGPM